jgi:hypothetical protein
VWARYLSPLRGSVFYQLAPTAYAVGYPLFAPPAWLKAPAPLTPWAYGACTSRQGRRATVLKIIRNERAMGTPVSRTLPMLQARNFSWAGGPRYSRRGRRRYSFVALLKCAAVHVNQSCLRDSVRISAPTRHLRVCVRTYIALKVFDHLLDSHPRLAPGATSLRHFVAKRVADALLRSTKISKIEFSRTL